MNVGVNGLHQRAVVTQTRFVLDEFAHVLPIRSQNHHPGAGQTTPTKRRLPQPSVSIVIVVVRTVAQSVDTKQHSLECGLVECQQKRDRSYGRFVVVPAILELSVLLKEAENVDPLDGPVTKPLGLRNVQFGAVVETEVPHTRQDVVEKESVDSRHIHHVVVGKKVHHQSPCLGIRFSTSKFVFLVAVVVRGRQRTETVAG